MLSSVTWTRRKNQRRSNPANKDHNNRTKARILKEVLMITNSKKVDTSLSKINLPYKLPRRSPRKRKKKGNCAESLRASQIDSLNIRQS